MSDHLTTKEIRDMAKVLDRREMGDYIFIATGKRMTTSEFDALMRRFLPKESALQSDIIQWLKKAYPGAFVWKAAAGPYSRQGIPDVCMVLDGYFYGFEIKRPYIGAPSKIQLATIDAIRQAGGVAAIISYPEQAREVIEDG